MIDKDLLVEKAREWIGTPWHHNQCSKNHGVDCVNFLAGVARDCGIEIKEIENYYRVPKFKNELIDKLLDYCNPKLIGINQGDILIFEFNGIASHVAIASERGNDIYMIHASLAYKKVIEHIYDDYWKNRLIMVLELKECS